MIFSLLKLPNSFLFLLGITLNSFTEGCDTLGFGLCCFLFGFNACDLLLLPLLLSFKSLSFLLIDVLFCLLFGLCELINEILSFGYLSLKSLNLLHKGVILFAGRVFSILDLFCAVLSNLPCSSLHLSNALSLESSGFFFLGMSLGSRFSLVSSFEGLLKLRSQSFCLLFRCFHLISVCLSCLAGLSFLEGQLFCLSSLLIRDLLGLFDRFGARICISLFILQGSDEVIGFIPGLFHLRYLELRGLSALIGRNPKLLLLSGYRFSTLSGLLLLL